MKPFLNKKDCLEILVIMLWTGLTALSVSAMILALMGLVSTAQAQDEAPVLLPLRAYDATRGVYAEALAQAHACFPERAKLAPAAYEAHFQGEAGDLYCALYIEETDTIYINVDRTRCKSPRETLLHELIHAYGFEHPQNEELLDTQDDPHYVELERCKRVAVSDPDNVADYPESRLSFDFTTSSRHVKRFSFGADVQLGRGPFALSARAGVFNWVNVSAGLDTYSPFGELGLSYSVSAGPLYGRITQSAALVSRGWTAPDGRYVGLATTHQFPTAVEAGIRSSSGWHIGVLKVHYSNGGVGQGFRVYDGLGISIGRTL